LFRDFVKASLTHSEQQ